MLRLVLTVMVFTPWLTLAASLPPQDCVDKVVHGNDSVEIKTFSSKEGKLLFFPDQGFDGVTIRFATIDKKSSHQLTPEDLCVNNSRWNSLQVTVQRGWNYQQCIFKSNYCSGKCKWVYDHGYDNFHSFSVEAHGASFWSINNISHKSRCATPTVSQTTPAYDTTDFDHTTSHADYNTPDFDQTTPAADYDTPDFDQTTPAADYDTPDFDQTTPDADYDTPAVARTTPAADYNTPDFPYTKPAANHNTPDFAYTKPVADYNTPAVAYTTPAADYNTPVVAYTKAAADYDTPAIAHTKPVADYDTPDFDQTTPAADYDTPAIAHTKPVADYDTPDVAYTTPVAAVTPNINSSAEASPLWPVVGVGSGAVVLAAGIAVACIAARRRQPRHSRMQQHNEEQEEQEEKQHQQQQPKQQQEEEEKEEEEEEKEEKEDCSNGDSSLLGCKDSVHISNNSLNEPFCAVIESEGEVIWQRDGNATDAPAPSTPPASVVDLRETPQ